MSYRFIQLENPHYSEVDLQRVFKSGVSWPTGGPKKAIDEHRILMITRNRCASLANSLVSLSVTRNERIVQLMSTSIGNTSYIIEDWNIMSILWQLLFSPLTDITDTFGTRCLIALTHLASCVMACDGITFVTTIMTWRIRWLKSLQHMEIWEAATISDRVPHRWNNLKHYENWATLILQ